MRVLRWAVDTPARYIAMIGSKRKMISVVKELEKEGIPRDRSSASSRPWAWRSAPISPEEIAISVVAEMIAVRRTPDVGLAVAFEIRLRRRNLRGTVEVIAGLILAAGASSRMGIAQGAAGISRRNFSRPADPLLFGGLLPGDRGAGACSRK